MTRLSEAFIEPPSRKLIRCWLRALSLRSRTLDGLDRHDGQAGFFRDRAVLLFDERARGRIAVEAAQHLAWNLAVGTLGAVFVDDVEQHELGTLCRFSRHGDDPSLLSRAPNPQGWLPH